jgi:glycine/D-amino acid oxidase-like deaminating enzyme
MLPVWGKFKSTSNVFYHGGHGHLGWTLAPATAKNLIDQLL